MAGTSGTVTDHAQALQRLLRSGAMSAAQLMERLDISQPTLSRTIQRLNSAVTSFRTKGDRTPRYALLRDLPGGVPPRQRVYRVLRSGSIEPFADLEFLHGGATLERRGSTTVLHPGLPPYLRMAAPAGYLGRELAMAAAGDAHFPASLADWHDDHRAAWLLTRGFNLAGNLVFGDQSLQRDMDWRGLPPTPLDQRAAQYEAQASTASVGPHGAGLGGDQPKFLALVEDRGHVLVKFARRGSRMAELLPLEHLALRELARAGVPAAQTALLVTAEHVFLEVQRFDRVGRHGRVGVLSAGAVDDALFGRRDAWPEFAARCEQARVLRAADARHVDTLAAFSELIGNNDRHFENLALLIGEDGNYAGLAPAYDILPMRYASLGGGVDPALLPITPRVGSIGARPEVWGRAWQAAERFWQAAHTEDLPAPLSPELRQLAAVNLSVARAFVAPLLPAGR
ncbi:MAG: HipA domain-containing protein [Aquincola sp.]|nr:HipA domain-containing protein [Aquincola sp.]